MRYTYSAQQFIRGSTTGSKRGFCPCATPVIIRRMKPQHPKTVRRRLLILLYDRYLTDPLEMFTPDELQREAELTREELQPNIFYLYERGLVELMTSYNPPMFSAARITADGIDLVEDHYEFSRRYPPEPGEYEDRLAEVPRLVERIVDEAEYAPLDGERRRALLRDVQYLRDELVRPAERWRSEVVLTVLDWIQGHFELAEGPSATVEELRQVLRERLSPRP